MKESPSIPPINAPQAFNQCSEPSSPSFFESMDGLWEIEMGRDALQGPVGPCGIFLLRSLLLYF